MPATRSTSRNNLPGFQSREERWRQAKDGLLRPNLEAEGDRLGVRGPCQVAPGCKDRWFIAGSRDGGLGWIVAMRQASLRAAAPLMTLLRDPRGVKGAAQSSGRSEAQQANRAHPRTPPRTSVTKSRSCFQI